MYTDGLIEGKVGAGPERLGSDGLIKLIEKERGQDPGRTRRGRQPAAAHRRRHRQARELNGGDLDDDLAVLVVSCSAPAGP